VVPAADAARVVGAVGSLQLVMSAKEAAWLETVIDQKLTEALEADPSKRRVHVAEIKCVQGQHMLLGYAINADLVIDDRRFLKQHDSFTTVPVGADAVLDLANVAALVAGSEWNEVVLQKVEANCHSFRSRGENTSVSTCTRTEHCLCVYCYLNQLDAGFVKALAQYILGNLSAVDSASAKESAGEDDDSLDSDEDDGPGRDPCIFPVLLTLQVPAEVRDSTGLWLEAPVRRSTDGSDDMIASEKVSIIHIVAQAAGIDVGGCSKNLMPLQLARTCNHRYCINSDHFVKPAVRFCPNTRASLATALRKVGYTDQVVKFYLKDKNDFDDIMDI
jgi:hypothetical protein